MLKKKMLSSLLIMFMLLFTVSTYTSAHEEFFYNSPVNGLLKAPVWWINTDPYNGNLKVAVNNTLVSGSWAGTNLTEALNAWHYSSAAVECYIDNGAFNANMVTASEAFWNGNCPDDDATSEVEGFTWSYDTDGSLVNDYPSAYYSTRNIRSATIYLNPSPDPLMMTQDSDYRQAMAHELGHVMGLGHSHYTWYNYANPITDPSLMSYHWEQNSTDYHPQQHDLTDLYNKYTLGLEL